MSVRAQADPAGHVASEHSRSRVTGSQIWRAESTEHTLSAGHWPLDQHGCHKAPGARTGAQRPLVQRAPAQQSPSALHDGRHRWSTQRVPQAQSRSASHPRRHSPARSHRVVAVYWRAQAWSSPQRQRPLWSSQRKPSGQFTSAVHRAMQYPSSPTARGRHVWPAGQVSSTPGRQTAWQPACSVRSP
jgi:hypothetical protein